MGGLAGLASLAAYILILIEAFKDSVVKGIFCLLCGLYMLYFALVDFEHEHKVLVILFWLFGGAIAGALMSMGGGMAGLSNPR